MTMIDFKKKTAELVKRKELQEMRKNLPPNQVMLPGGKIIDLNTQQLTALESMVQWSQGPGTSFTLAGYAGTGKTTITQELLRRIRSRYPDHKVAVSAPTHKAKKVISRATGRDAYTIQKLLGLRPNTDLENFDINDPQFDPLAEKAIRFYGLVILDEASMLNKDLYELLISEARSWGAKLLFMGDPAQLPPVGENMSRVFTHVDASAELTTVERQAQGNPLMPLYDAIRSDIQSPVDLFDHTTALNDSHEGVEFHSDQKTFEAAVFPLFASEQYRSNPDHVKLVTWMNESVRLWNQQIRTHLYGAEAPPLLVGELLMAYSTVTRGPEEIVLENSAEYRVLEIESSVSHGIQCWSVKLKGVDTTAIIRTLVVKKQGIPRFLAKFHYLLSAAKAAQGKARRFAWGQYYGFKNEHLLLEDVMDQGKLAVRKDLDYGYAITVHKSQGSTFTYVAVSENNIDRNSNKEERNKLKYVALSRPTTRAIVLSNKTTAP
jgi:hypothetical protein